METPKRNRGKYYAAGNWQTTLRGGAGSGQPMFQFFCGVMVILAEHTYHPSNTIICYSTMAESTPRTINWAILGTGSIANDMVQILKQLPHTTVLVIGSRTQSSATSFGSKWGIPKCVSYEEACSDPDVDVVYIATPSMRHPDDCRMALAHGKAILCEKSMAPDHIVAKSIMDAAKDANSLFVHGVWSRFFPTMTKIREIINSGEIGEVRSARASFCQNDGAGSCSALAETGIYCAQFLQWVLGGDDEGGIGPVVKGATQILHESGVDEHVTAIIEFPGKKIGTFECSLAHNSERSATVYGTLGVIDVPFPFWQVFGIFIIACLFLYILHHVFGTSNIKRFSGALPK
jgi:dihydrodiol dehydrogenase / D-xylose 1-dehydrogenase (NADP)